jgi:hypothetical protein
VAVQCRPALRRAILALLALAQGRGAGAHVEHQLAGLGERLAGGGDQAAGHLSQRAAGVAPEQFARTADRAASVRKAAEQAWRLIREAGEAAGEAARVRPAGTI